MRSDAFSDHVKNLHIVGASQPRNGLGSLLTPVADFYAKLWKTGEAGVEIPLDVLRGGRVEKITVKSIDRERYFRPKPTY